MKTDQIIIGKTYHNGLGRKHRVNKTAIRRYTQCIWYTPISEKGKEGAEQYCAEGTFAGWAKGEWNPDFAEWKSEKRKDAAVSLFEIITLPSGTDLTEVGKFLDSFVDKTIEAVKDEIRQELGIAVYK